MKSYSKRSQLPTIAASLLSELRATQSTSVPPLQDWIPQVSEDLESPQHLSKVTDVLESIGDESKGVRFAFSVPPRHWKSTTLLHGIVWLFHKRPGLSVLYLTHSHDFAEEQSRAAQRIMRDSGLSFGDRQTFRNWTTSNGCSFMAAGLIGGATGRGFDLIVVDDPYRSRKDAESRTTRNRITESFVADVMTRQKNTPTDVIVLHTRWHVDDLIGQITGDEWADGNPFEYLNLPALNDEGEGLLEYWDEARFRSNGFMANEYEWWSLYMGQPRPRGAEVFGTPTFCKLSDLPHAHQAGVGIDLAYTAKTQADYSTAVVLRLYDGKYYVADVRRRQVQAPDFAAELQSLFAQVPAVPRWYCSGTEKGVAQLLNAGGVKVDARQVTSDKYVRALPVSEAWNAGRILVPSDAPWTQSFLAEVQGFTGINDNHDDQVDALAAAFDTLASSNSPQRVETWDRGTGRKAVSGFNRFY